MTDRSTGFSQAERDAMKQRAAELREESSRGRGNKAAAQEADVLATIEGMSEPDRALAGRIHAIVTEAAPELRPKLWYGQPAYARGGKVVCFFRSGADDGERFSTFGFTAEAALDQEGFWPTSYAVTDLTADAVDRIRALVTQAVG
ncbi:DUF1801 domain-containing protein [Demequina sp. SO4-18]|uniref:DUF1801 domain-containing protein n=1 Tax=Demequina sp. SO4-18 TaxID=3401026 RepID=UPI003B59651E